MQQINFPMNRPRSRVVLSLVGIVLVVFFVPILLLAQQYGRSNELVVQGFQLLNKKKYSKAIRVLREANKLEDGESLAAILGLARAFNAAGEEEKAAGFARQILEKTSMIEIRTWAHIELAQALGSGPTYDRMIIEQAIEGIRAFLQAQPTGASSEQARIRLCQIRGGLPAENPFALSRNPVYADGDTSVDPNRVSGAFVVPRNLFAPVPMLRAPPGPPVRGQWQIDITAIIDRDGCMRNVKNADGSNSPEDVSVRETVATWVFEPAVLSGKPVSSIYNNTVNFRRQ